jgi:hypothetical protein
MVFIPHPLQTSAIIVSPYTFIFQRYTVQASSSNNAAGLRGYCTLIRQAGWASLDQGRAPEVSKGLFDRLVSSIFWKSCLRLTLVCSSD